MQPEVAVESVKGDVQRLTGWDLDIPPAALSVRGRAERDELPARAARPRLQRGIDVEPAVRAVVVRILGHEGLDTGETGRVDDCDAHL